jgi:hypothetical protein
VAEELSHGDGLSVGKATGESMSNIGVEKIKQTFMPMLGTTKHEN